MTAACLDLGDYGRLSHMARQRSAPGHHAAGLVLPTRVRYYVNGLSGPSTEQGSPTREARWRISCQGARRRAIAFPTKRLRHQGADGLSILRPFAPMPSLDLSNRKAGGCGPPHGLMPPSVPPCDVLKAIAISRRAVLLLYTASAPPRRWTQSGRGLDRLCEGRRQSPRIQPVKGTASCRPAIQPAVLGETWEKIRHAHSARPRGQRSATADTSREV